MMRKLFVVMVVIGVLFANIATAKPISQKKAKMFNVSAQAIEVVVDEIDTTIPQGKRLVKSFNRIHDIYVEVARTWDDQPLEGQFGVYGDLDQKIRAYNKAVGYEAIEPLNIDFGTQGSGIPNYR